MRFDKFPFQIPADQPKNRIVKYYPDEDFDVSTYPEEFRLQPISGPLTGDRLNFDDFEELEPATTREFDAGQDWNLILKGSPRGRRRDHALTLAAKYSKPLLRYSRRCSLNHRERNSKESWII